MVLGLPLKGPRGANDNSSFLVPDHVLRDLHRFSCGILLSATWVLLLFPFYR